MKYDEEVNAVVLDEDGLLLTLAAGSVIAVSSTVAPSTVKGIDAAAQANMNMSDAANLMLPITGAVERVCKRSTACQSH